MEIIDILTPDNDKLPTFQVNTAVTNVLVTGIAAPGAKLTSANGVFSRFQRGDNFTILSVGVFVPERFCIWDYPDVSGIKRSSPLMQLNGTLGGGLTPIFTFGNIGDMKIPFQNYEFSIGVFNDTERLGLIDASFELSMLYPVVANTLSISMVDVPAVMNGLIFRIVPFIKVIHNFPLF